ncbi:SRPBCC family protein [Streptomyces brasiliensis]|uniref:Activator of HSP90 ATPase n=1 Tax=Streptomyces brasiliensis TaxID=1954 RepID=A0A917NEQ5_9ACTN|nr:SRPBCC family protein [Streptomyces brasiliensis]GGI95082.1 activator of HSP90 ATPase [Streptomyces brasiliensis]
MSDIVDRINDIHRRVGRRTVADGEARTVLLRRTYDAPAEDVWDACTDPERIGRWFLPVTGDLKPGGRYQLQGNAGGEILECEPPERLKVSWLMGEAPGFSEVEVRLTPEGAERTVFELEHVAVVPPEFWDQFGPGAVGVGWDLTVLGLGLYLTGNAISPAEAEAWQAGDEARAAMTRSSEAWGEAYAASGADEDVVASAVTATTGFYVPPKEGE